MSTGEWKGNINNEAWFFAWMNEWMVQFSSVTQLCPTLCDPVDCSISGLPVHQQLLELAQTHVHWVGDATHLILCCPLLLLSSIFPASGSFPMSQLFTLSGQNIEASASTSVLPMNIQNWFSLGLTGLISLQSKGLSVVFSSTTVQKHQFFSTKPSLWSNSHICTWLLENIALTRWTFVSKVISLLFKMLSSLVIAFPTKSKHLLISWLQSQSTVILEPKKIKFVTVSIVSPSICHEVMGPHAMIFIFLTVEF